MHAILFCTKEVTCIPVSSMPEAQLPFCNLPLLVRILQRLDREGVSRIVLVGADAGTRELADSLTLAAELCFSEKSEKIKIQVPTIVLRRLCLPEWDMAELESLCGDATMELMDAEGTPVHAMLCPADSTLDAAARTSVVLSEFCMPHTPQDYMRMQRELLKKPGEEQRRIGQNVTLGRQVSISTDTIIGNDCIIGDHAVLEGCVIGDGVQIGARAQLRSCLVCRRALIDRSLHLSDAVIGEGEIASAHLAKSCKRRICVDEFDGIHEGLPRWNNTETALRTGAALTALGMRIAVGFENEASGICALAAACGAASQGAQVWNCGMCALSQLLYAAKRADCNMVLYVHGNRVHYLTIRSAEGTPLTSAQRQTLRRAIESHVSTRITDCGNFLDGQCLLTLWEEECRKILPPLQFTVEVCCGNTVLRNAVKALFFVGCGDRLVLNLSDDGTQASVFSAETGMVSHEQLLRLVISGTDGFAKQEVFTDAVLLFAHVLRILHEKECTLAQAYAKLPPLHTVKRELSTRLSRAAVEKIRCEQKDTRITLTLPSASGIVQLAAFADSMETATELCSFWEEKLRAAEGGWEDFPQCGE